MYQKYALVIGNSNFKDPHFPKLNKPRNDAKEFATLLESQKHGGFDDVISLIDADSATIRRHIAQLFSNRTTDDMLLFYYSGHGIVNDQGHLFLVASDSEKSLLSVTAVSSRFIQGEMEQSNSRRQVVVLDCCHSGAFSGAKSAIGTNVHTAAAFHRRNGYGSVVFTATDSTQFAWEENRIIGNISNSIFTHYLIHGIKSGKADMDGDGLISFDELADYTTKQVQKSTSNQNPKKFSNDVNGDLIISVNPKPKPATLPQTIKTGLQNGKPQIRKLAVDELGKLLNNNDLRMRIAAENALTDIISKDIKEVSDFAAYILRQHKKNNAHTTTSVNVDHKGTKRTADVKDAFGKMFKTDAKQSEQRISQTGWSDTVIIILAIASFFIPLIGIVVGIAGLFTGATRNQAGILIGLGFLSAICYSVLPLFFY